MESRLRARAEFNLHIHTFIKRLNWIRLHDLVVS